MMNNKSFTLIELLVSVSIFTSLVVIASGIFISSLRAQRENLAYQQLLDQTSYVMEYMSRALRMAQKDINGDCISPKFNYEETQGGDGLEFKNYQGLCREFFWDTGTNRLKEVKDGEEHFLTSSDLDVISFNIELTGETQNDSEQPRVTIFLSIEGKERSRIKIQTTVSQRDLDIRK